MDHHHHDHNGSTSVASAIVRNASEILRNATVAAAKIVTSTVSPQTADDFGLFFPPADSETLAGFKKPDQLNVDHSTHQHHTSHSESQGSAGHSHHEMKMWFHGGCNEIILFDFWKIDSLYGLIMSSAIIFVMAAGYEALKWFRVYLQMSTKRCERESPLLNGHSNGTSDDVYCPTTTPPVITVRRSRSSMLSRSSKLSPFAGFRIIDATLYVIQLTMAYWLMLIAMTYNTYLTAAVVLGAGFGHWLFAVMNSLNADNDHAEAFTSDACH